MHLSNTNPIIIFNRAGLETITKCENVLNLLKVKMIQVEKAGAPPIVSKQPVVDQASPVIPAPGTNNSGHPLPSTANVDLLEVDRGPRCSPRDHRSSERSSPTHRRCSRGRTANRDDHCTERKVAGAPKCSNPCERTRRHSSDSDRSTSRDRKRRRRRASKPQTSSSHERYRRHSPDRAIQYTTNRRTSSRERYRSSEAEQHGVRSDSRDPRSAVADEKSMSDRLGSKIPPKQYENQNIVLRKDEKPISSSKVVASDNIRILTAAGPSRPDTADAADVTEMCADNAPCVGSELYEMQETNTSLATMVARSSSVNLDVLVRKREQINKELIALDEMNQVDESVLTAEMIPATPMLKHVTTTTTSPQLPTPVRDVAIEPPTESQFLAGMVQQALAVKTSRQHQSTEERPLSPTAMLANQIEPSNSKPSARDSLLPEMLPANPFAKSGEPALARDHHEQAHHLDFRVRSTANHPAAFSSTAVETPMPLSSLPLPGPQSNLQHRRAKAAEFPDQQHPQNQQYHHNHHQQHQHTTTACVDHKKTSLRTEQPQQPIRGSTSSNTATSLDQVVDDANTKQNNNTQIAGRSQFDDILCTNNYSQTFGSISTKNASLMRNFKIPKKCTNSTFEPLTAEPKDTIEPAASPTADLLLPTAQPDRKSSSTEVNAPIRRRRRSTRAPPTVIDQVMCSAAGAASETAQTSATPVATSSSSTTTSQFSSKKEALIELIQSLDNTRVQQVYDLLLKADGLAAANCRAADGLNVAIEADVELPDDNAVLTMNADDTNAADVAAAADGAAAEVADCDAAADDTTDDDAPLIKAPPVVGRTKKRLNELQILNEDIRTMFISEGVLTATGRRNHTMSEPASELPAKRMNRGHSRPLLKAAFDDGDELVTLPVAKKPDDGKENMPHMSHMFN